MSLHHTIPCNSKGCGETFDHPASGKTFKASTTAANTAAAVEGWHISIESNWQFCPICLNALLNKGRP